MIVPTSKEVFFPIKASASRAFQIEDSSQKQKIFVSHNVLDTDPNKNLKLDVAVYLHWIYKEL